MKVRNGFVSNSSSSSFIVIDASTGHDVPQFKGDLVMDEDKGEYEFGWGPDTLGGWGSMAIFARFQAEYDDNDIWKEMLDDVLKEETGADNIIWKVTTSYGVDDMTEGYIDHQSCAYEGANTEMFNSKQDLKDFIFGKRSSIHLDNDNH